MAEAQIHENEMENSPPNGQYPIPSRQHLEGGRADGKTLITVPTNQARGLEDYLSDTETFVEDFLPAEKEPTYPCTILVGGCPTASADKTEKLMAFMKMRLSKFGDVKCLDMAVDAEGNQTGIFFVTFATPNDAHNAAEKLNNSVLTKGHVATTMMLDDLDALLQRGEEYKPPEQPSFFSRDDCYWYLLDEAKRPQFMLRHGNSTEVFWHDSVERQPIVSPTRRPARNWTESHAIWSPNGSYLATFHQQGIMLWKGKDFERAMRFQHNDVQHAAFSPDEEYLMTWDGSPPTRGHSDAIRIFRVQSGEYLAFFHTPEVSPSGGTKWPLFTWSYDASMFASASASGDVCVYSSSSMQLLERDDKRQALSFPSPVGDFEWSPSDNYLALWSPEKGDSPGRLVLLELPTRKELATKNIYQVRSARLHWHSKGDYLCLYIERLGKNKKPGHTQLELFRMREKNIPVEMIELDLAIKEFAWEGCGSAFSILAEDKNTSKTIIQIYHQHALKAKGWEKTVELCDLPYGINTVKWSPTGPHFVMSAFGSEGLLYFGTLMNDGKVLDITHKNEHFMLNELTWDPTGRFVTSACQAVLHSRDPAAERLSSESGYAVWSFQGRLQYRFQKEKLYKFSWRPTPPSLLEPEKIAHIRKTLKEYSKEYDRIDEEQRTAKKTKFFEERKAKVDKFDILLEKLAQARRNHALYDAWEDAEDALEDKYEWEDKEEPFEVVLEHNEEIAEE